MTTAPSETFVPLTLRPSKASNGDFRVLLAERPETARALRELPPLAADSPGHSPGRPGCEPRITLQKEGDRISGIQVHCTCGQVIDLKCAYEEPGPTR
jgi:hypothetical protein